MRQRSPRSFLAFLACSALCGCSGLRAEDHTLAQTTAGGSVEGRPTLGLPIALPGQPTCLIPFSIETRKWVFHDQDPYTRGGFASAASFFGADDGWFVRGPAAPGGVVRWHNAILSDLASGEQWTVLTQRGVISRWRVLGRTPPRDEPFRSEALVFVATLDDSNSDHLLDDRDASVAIVADGDGRNPRVVTPLAAQVWDFSHDEENSRVYFLVAQDTNADGKLTSDDAPVPFALDLRARQAAAPAVSDELRQRAEALLRD